MNATFPSRREPTMARPRPGAMPWAVALALLASPAHALMLGEPDVRSFLGRPLDMRIPVDGAGSDAADASCFALMPSSGPGAAALKGAQLTVEQQAGRTYLRVRTSQPVLEPAAILDVRAACTPAAGMFVRQYGILLDPMPASMPSAPLRFADDAPLPLAQVATVTPAPSPSLAVAQPPVRKAARHRITHKHSVARHGGHALVAARPGRHGAFMLKLSGPVLDLAPSRQIDDAQRAQLREARAMLDADDYTSAMMALRDRIDVMQRRLAELQMQAAKIDASPRVAQGSAAVAPGAVQAPAVVEPTLGTRTLRTIQSAAERIGAAAWWWAVVALLGLAALLWWPVTSLIRRRRAEQEADAVAMPYSEGKGVETGRFAPRPPQIVAPAPPMAATAPVIAFDDTEEAIRTARDLYNSGERLQAAGVLQLAIESHPERVAPWLPLFDLLMRERLVTEFGELARGFRSLHGASPAWKTVQRAGQQIDPGNALYADEAEPAQVAA